VFREERRLRVFNRRAMSYMSGSKREEVIGECRKLHKEELHFVLLIASYLGDKMKEDKMRWACRKWEGRREA